MASTYRIILACSWMCFIQAQMIAQVCEKLIWADEFNGPSLDSTKWNYDIGTGCPDLCGWGNNEQQYYTNSPDNVSVGNGVLRITARQDSVQGTEYSSSRVTTSQKGDFRYGRIEASIKLPETKGLWPAFWLLPTDEVYGEWPRSGEIDILELVGQNENEVFGTLHTGLPWKFVSRYYALSPPKSFADTFHVFSLEWNPDTIFWLVDGNLYSYLTPDSISPWMPFQEDFHLILNIAVGGNLPGPPDSSTVFPQTMEVDYVRVYNQPSRLQVRGQKPIIGAKDMKYHTFDIQGADYIWSVPAGATITAGQGTPEVTVDWGCTAGNINLELRTDCDTVQLTYTVNNFVDATIEGLSTVTENLSGLVFKTPAIGGGTYTWSVPMDASIVSGQGTPEIRVDWGCSDGEVTVAANGSCATAINDTLEVNLPTYAISGFSSVPINSMGIGYSMDSIGNASYSWSVPSDATIVSGQGSPQIEVNFGTQDGDVRVDVTTSCGTKTYLVNVNIDPSFIYCDFDGTDLAWGDFSGSTFEKVSNPFPGGINTSEHVGKTRKDPGSVAWAGIYADLAGEMDLVSHPLLNLKVYSERSGVVKLKLEDLTTGAAAVELDISHDSADQWVNWTWDFTGYPTDTFERVALFFDFGQSDTSYWYFDDFIGENSGSVALEEVLDYSIKVFPNPGNGLYQIEIEGDFSSGRDYSVKVTDIQGKSVSQAFHKSGEDRIQVDLRELPNGTYFIQLVSPDTRYVKAVMKLD